MNEKNEVVVLDEKEVSRTVDYICTRIGRAQVAMSEACVKLYYASSNFEKHEYREIVRVLKEDRGIGRAAISMMCKAGRCYTVLLNRLFDVEDCDKRLMRVGYSKIAELDPIIGDDDLECELLTVAGYHSITDLAERLSQKDIRECVNIVLDSTVEEAEAEAEAAAEAEAEAEVETEAEVESESTKKIAEIRDILRSTLDYMSTVNIEENPLCWDQIRYNMVRVLDICKQ